MLTYLVVFLPSGDKTKLYIRQQIIFCFEAVICHVFTQKILSGDVVRVQEFLRIGDEDTEHSDCRRIFRF